ncbi:beta-lactamase [Corchorus capsularis]|uniref:Beta-lactamase n=1 Tax=Corchorus capsularis TaxID=210143 RepID=A0A1R3KAP1_COCAP|nr:beta-lactamase [Corchorus capsularis]
MASNGVRRSGSQSVPSKPVTSGGRFRDHVRDLRIFKWFMGLVLIWLGGEVDHGAAGCAARNGIGKHCALDKGEGQFHGVNRGLVGLTDVESSGDSPLSLAANSLESNSTIPLSASNSRRVVSVGT